MVIYVSIARYSNPYVYCMFHENLLGLFNYCVQKYFELLKSMEGEANPIHQMNVVYPSNINNNIISFGSSCFSNQLKIIITRDIIFSSEHLHIWRKPRSSIYRRSYSTRQQWQILIPLFLRFTGETSHNIHNGFIKTLYPFVEGFKSCCSTCVDF